MMNLSVDDDVRAFVIENFLFGQDAQLTRPTNRFSRPGSSIPPAFSSSSAFSKRRTASPWTIEDLVPANLDSVERVARFVERKMQSEGATRAG